MFLKGTALAVSFVLHCSSSFVPMHMYRLVYTKAVGCPTIHNTTYLVSASGLLAAYKRSTLFCG